jgi:hypothetical protein
LNDSTAASPIVGHHAARQFIQQNFVTSDCKQFRMRTISIDISDLEFQKFGLKTDRLSFSAFVDIVSREISRQNLAKVEYCVKDNINDFQ